MNLHDKLREKRGTMARLAARLGITIQSIAKWDRVPAGRVRKVAHFLGVSADELRPDLVPSDSEMEGDHAANRPSTPNAG